MQHNISRFAAIPDVSRHFSRGLGAASLALLLGTALPAGAAAQVRAPAAATEVAEAIEAGAGLDRKLKPFYAARGFRPLWLSPTGTGAEAEKLVQILETSDLDGLEPREFRPGKIRKALKEVQEDGSPKDVARAEALLSNAFVDYVRALRTMEKPPLAFTDPELRPSVPEKLEVLERAAAAPSLLKYLEDYGWMHPLYGGLRAALAGAVPDSHEARVLRVNLQRLRVLPAEPDGRHIVVDAGGARLLMYEGRRQVDSMKVIVGRPVTPTPMMASMIRYATLNPYWNVPIDLVQERIAPQVVRVGPAYLKKRGFEVLSDWSAAAAAADPKLVDWHAVSAGLRPVRVRQLPGPGNGMGKVKFMFPNGQDIYLHDTPDKSLFRSAERYFSAGCIRLENADKLGRWLFGKPLRARSKEPELRVELPEPVPIYVTYLTAFPESRRVAIRQDSYGRDGLGSDPNRQAALSGG